ncbi:MAG: SDR family oxidoreductase [Candidatus Hodarchaeales archaeon]|jgi:NAD(P)-dependent dehydrogenase (short-subunit alcohol dehydrogenase family)
MVRILITGANRGLGFEFTKQYLALGNEVIATYRENNDISELLKLKNSFQNNLTLIPLDVSVSESRESAYNAVKEKFDSLDILINNAGMVTKRHLTVGKLHEDDILRVFEVNSISPLLMTEKFADLLQKSSNPKVVNISSMMGSISNRQNTSNFSYCACASKAALNMFSKLLSNSLLEENIIVIPMHPGWVKTRMGTEEAPIEPEKSISGMIKVIESLTMTDSGKFLEWTGNEIMW